MIDKRLLKEINHEIDESLQGISDTTILLNFQKAIVSLYPHLIPINAYAYDSWDDTIMPLYYEMVCKTFAFKYGIDIKPNETQPYMFTLSCYKGINHIECIPKQSSIRALIHQEWIDLDKATLEEKIIVFKSFGDGKHFLTGGIKESEVHNVSFNLVEVDIVHAKTGYCTKSSIFIDKEQLEFEFIAETYDQKAQN